MPLLLEFRKLEETLVAQLATLDLHQNDSRLKLEAEFEENMRILLGEYGYSLSHIPSLLAHLGSVRPNAASSVPKGGREPNSVKVNEAECTDEPLETGGAHQEMSVGWKADYGSIAAFLSQAPRPVSAENLTFLTRELQPPTSE
ncbi:transcriptional regulator [Pseudomonas amygdali]|uniref:transcriptional regulator n=1 Tax=Pseudomonas amygdali TaxID=47877 RepID=UPI000EFE846F|nr:transcriptional regulator [Pseudomonas amygdali]